MKTNSGKKGEGMPVVRNPQFYFREDQNWTQEKIASFMKEVRFILFPYQIPKEIRFVSNFRETYSGKIIRENQE